MAELNLRIVTLNIAGRKNIEARINKIVSFLDKEDIDIVCLQEVTFDASSSLAHRINSRLATPYNFIQADLAEEYIRDGDSQTDGLAILSRGKIRKAKIATLAKAPEDENGRPDFHRRIAQLVELENGIKLVNTHLASNNNSHLQFEELLRLASSDHVLLGDFNLPKQKMQGYKNIWGKNYSCSIDFKDYVSFPRENQTFDYILAPASMKIKSIRVIEGLSDHNAIVVDLG